MENIIGIAISYLEEKGIDTTNLSLEEIIAKYNEMLAQEGAVEETPVEEVKEEAPVEEAPEEAKEETPVEAEEDALSKLLAENKEIIDGLSAEQKALFEEIIKLVK